LKDREKVKNHQLSPCSTLIQMHLSPYSPELEKRAERPRRLQGDHKTSWVFLNFSMLLVADFKDRKEQMLEWAQAAQ
jgi:hypothetical protein